MQIKINSYGSKDEEQLMQLLKLCSEDDVLLHIVNSARLKFAYSAIIDDKLVGILASWKSSFHPYCTYFRILGNPLYNSLNIEEQLLSKVKELKPEDFPLQTSAWETSNNLINIYTNNGFKEIRRTYLPTLEVSNLGEYNLNIRNNYQIKTLEEVLSDEMFMEELTLLVKRIYEQTHLVNPVADINLDKWQELILDDVVQNGSYIYVDENENNIMAYAFLHESDKSDSLDLGWVGAIDKEHKQLIPQLVLNQIEYANKHNFHFIMGEFDTTDEYAMEVLNHFPFAPSPTWITFQKSN
ncbi:hypothetical protein [Ornithinibacillus halophilus]|uniref:N-acetyltransferase domain-containing protein n=1 Tax=Ornithinibacillus halophilus TaxID=930117 RepID=A0A1M5G5V6_9BACI|nr:hypothetical protein [Ornithinibacillus halophilus]SHF99044.1 hypothetical protein SAMN05216225_101178 [Ornithinibacillus halophilus]